MAATQMEGDTGVCCVKMSQNSHVPLANSASIQRKSLETLRWGLPHTQIWQGDLAEDFEYQASPTHYQGSFLKTNFNVKSVLMRVVELIESCQMQVSLC